jgi:hypothetical protein
MNTITKGDFLTMVKLQHLEVLTQAQLSQNTKVINSYMQKALIAELSDGEIAISNAMISDVAGLQQWEVLRDDFTKAVVYTRREQVDWDDAERGEFGELIKARGGVYKLTGENKKLGRVGQKYGEVQKPGLSTSQMRENQNNEASKKELEGKKDTFIGDLDKKVKHGEIDSEGASNLARKKEGGEKKTKKYDFAMTNEKVVNEYKRGKFNIKIAKMNSPRFGDMYYGISDTGESLMTTPNFHLSEKDAKKEIETFVDQYIKEQE